VVRGVLATTHFTTDSLRGYHTEVRDLVFGPHSEASELPLDGDALMELRTGTIEVTLRGDKKERKAGEYWLVKRGARLAIRNVGELAVIRTILFRTR